MKFRIVGENGLPASTKTFDTSHDAFEDIKTRGLTNVKLIEAIGKKTIWTSDINIDDFKEAHQESLDEMHHEEEDLYTWATELNDFYLYDEMDNLNIDTNPIVVLLDLGLWNGRRLSVAAERPRNIKDCIKSNGDSVEVYVDEIDFTIRESHHDGTNFYTFREIKKGIDRNMLEHYLDEYASGKTERIDEIYEMTQSLTPRIRKVYGF